VLIKQGTNMNT